MYLFILSIIQDALGLIYLSRNQDAYRLSCLLINNVFGGFNLEK